MKRLFRTGGIPVLHFLCNGAGVFGKCATSPFGNKSPLLIIPYPLLFHSVSSTSSYNLAPLARHYNAASTYNNITVTWDKHRYCCLPSVFFSGCAKHFPLAGHPRLATGMPWMYMDVPEPCWTQGKGGPTLTLQSLLSFLHRVQLHQQTAILPAHLTRTSVGGSRQITAALTG